MKKRLLSIILTISLCLSLLPMSALAEETVPKITIDAVDANGNIVRGAANLGDAILTADIMTLADNKFYIVQGNVTIDGDLTINSAEGGLILGQNATLKVNGALIFNGGSRFGIYGASNNGTDAGELVIKNSNGNGAAIRTDKNTTPQLSIHSGELTINGGKSEKLVEGVELYSTNQIHEATLNDEKVLPAKWRGVSSIGGTSLVLEYCGHSEDNPEYVEYVKVGKTQHRWKCEACGFEGAAVDCFDVAKETLADIKPNGNATHTLKCICGREKTENCSYESLDTPEVTPDGKGHTKRMCSVCESSEGEAAGHTYNDKGVCEVCKFEPFAKDENDNLYGTTKQNSGVSSDINNALAEGHTITLWRPDAVTDKTIQDIHIDFNAEGKSAGLNMNGKALETTAGTLLDVSAGTLIVEGEAKILETGTQNGSGSAIDLSGGKLVFEGDLTAQGGGNNPAINATGGTLDIQGAVALTGGLKLSGSAVLATKLKAGDVLNGGVSVQGSSTYKSVNELLGEGVAFEKTEDGTTSVVNGNVTSLSGNVTVVEHKTHTYVDGVCACGVSCPHSNINFVLDAQGYVADRSKGGTCAKCGKTDLKAVVGTTAYTDLNEAINAWQTNGGTLKLYADGGAFDAFSDNAKGKELIIDLNGCRINDNHSVINLNGVDLTIKNSRSYDECFGPINADSGKLTMESGYLQGLNVAANSKATVELKGGRVHNLVCPNPFYTLMPNGYAMLNSTPVEPTKISDKENEQTYDIINAQLKDVDTTKSGSTAFGSGTIPFTLSLSSSYTTKQNVPIGRMKFCWYYIDKNGAAKQLIESADVTPVDGLYSYDVTTNMNGEQGYRTEDKEKLENTIKENWANMTPGEYDVICVVSGKEAEGAYCWETALTGYKLTVTPASIESAVVTVDDTNLTYTGKPQSPTVTVKLNGEKLVEGEDKDYTVSYSDNTNAGTATVTVTGKGNYTGTVKKTWTIQPKEVTATVEITDTDRPFTYTGSAIEPDVTVKVGNTVIDLNEYTVVYTSNTDVGTATVTIRDNPGGNYTISGSTTFTIVKADSGVTAVPTANTLTYNGGEQALVTAGTANGGTMQYSLSADGAYTAAIPTGKNAGTYTVYYKVVGDGNHNDAAGGSVEVTISKAPVTVTAKDKSAYVGSEVPALPTEPVKDTDYTVSGLFGTDTLSGTVKLAYEGAPDMTKTGETVIKISGPLTNDNYVVSYADGKLSVTNKPSSGSSSKPSYSVNTPGKTENGSVSLSAKNAVKGSTVTVTVQPDSGYVLDKLTVTDQDGKALAVTDLGGGKFRFVMPAGTVKVEASFAEEMKAPAFADVSEGAYYYEAVQWALERGITDGISEDLFGPNQPCTRGQIVTFLWRAAGSPEPKGTSSFADVPAESYYAKAVAWAVENGVTNGTGEGTFSPDAPCDRAQSVTFLFRALGEETEGGANFSDVPAESYYADAVAWAAENGITTGTSSTTFSPNDTCTRGQIVTFLYRTYQGK